MPCILGSYFNFSFMTVLDSFIKRVGQDKLDHHLVGALICFCVSTVSILQEGSFSWDALFGVIIGTVVALFFAIVKDLIIDEKADWRDIVATVTGCVWSLVTVALGVWFNQLS